MALHWSSSGAFRNSHRSKSPCSSASAAGVICTNCDARHAAATATYDTDMYDTDMQEATTRHAAFYLAADDEEHVA